MLMCLLMCLLTLAAPIIANQLMRFHAQCVRADQESKAMNRCAPTLPPPLLYGRAEDISMYA